MAKNWSIESRITPQERNPWGMFSTRGSSKNAKLGLVEKLVFEKNDILGQNFRSKSKTDVKKVCQKISCLPQSPASS